MRGQTAVVCLSHPECGLCFTRRLRGLPGAWLPHHPGLPAVVRPVPAPREPEPPPPPPSEPEPVLPARLAEPAPWHKCGYRRGSVGCQVTCGPADG